MFEILIPKRTAAERMVVELTVIGDGRADLDLTAAYARFTVEVMERVQNARTQRSKHRG